MFRIKKILKENKFFYMLYSTFFGFLLNFFKLFIRVDNSVILFNCFGGKRFDDSPKAIYDYIINDEKYDKFNIYWAFDDCSKYEIPRGMKIKNNSIKFFIIALKAKYWITNSSMERGLKFKNKKTVYINTWHGTTIKKLEKDQKNKAFCSNVSKPSLYYAQSRYDVEVFSRAFDVDRKNILIVGLPRNDELAYNISINEINNIKLKLNIPQNKKVVLYMPTYREYYENLNGNYIRPPININKWKKALKDNYVLLFRAHYETNKILGIEFDDFVYNVSDYGHLNDLLKISDILISDYSSVMFDYSILERPIFSFAYDYEEYLEKRGCYIDITKELPNGICKTEDELLNKIVKCDYTQETIKTRKFKEKYIEAYGNASSYIDKIIDV